MGLEPKSYDVEATTLTSLPNRRFLRNQTHSKLPEKSFKIRLTVIQEQCDQMVRLFVQYLAIDSNEYLPKTHKKFQSNFTII